MKKIILIIASILLISGCTEENTTSISIEKSLPKTIEKIVKDNEEYGVQLITNEKDTYYIVYETNKRIDEIPGMSETVGSEVIVNIKEGEEQNNTSRYIFKLKSASKYTAINLKINGTPAEFDVITIF